MSVNIIDDYIIPEDWEYPIFDTVNKVHNWKNYVIPPVRNYWFKFTPELKRRLAANF